MANEPRNPHCKNRNCTATLPTWQRWPWCARHTNRILALTFLGIAALTALAAWGIR
jgi:hypothetical protein